MLHNDYGEESHCLFVFARQQQVPIALERGPEGDLGRTGHTYAHNKAPV